MNKERILVLLMRFNAVVLLLALGAVVMPFAWMDVVHRGAGMGPLPDSTIVHYLTRSASALYAGYGAVILFLSFDVRRYQPVIVFKALIGIVFGAMMLTLDVVVGMPWHWTVCEGPFIIAVCVAILWLAKGLKSQWRQASVQ
ncbi:MAG: hypothetical protein FJ388_10645 [Verrucomicrobia bacterium]|nr:hypothetical protein [Verrucomicrobiota bacterium]